MLLKNKKQEYKQEYKDAMIKPVFRFIIKIAVFFIFFNNLYAETEIDFPDIIAQDPTLLSGVQEYVDDYDKYSGIFIKYYSPAVLLTTHLTSPVGKDNIGSFPGFYLGFATGVSFANSQAIRSQAAEKISDAGTPEILPALALSINMGLGITPKWDVRASFFPTVSMDLGRTNGSDLSLRYGHFKIRSMYNVYPSSFLKPGLSIGGFFIYNRGRVTVKSDLLEETPGFSLGDIGGHSYTMTDFHYTIDTSAGWQYFGLGPEIKAWFDLEFVMAYVGYGISFQFGRLGIDLTGNIEKMTIGSTAGSLNGDYTGGSFRVYNTKVPAIAQQRLIAGGEIRFLFVSLVAEIQFDISNRLTGLTLGAASYF
ncbi:MAG: hypothetical protein OEZ13_13555 [Spirochaetia bacterium]|nr:hypothetical protein [Spirochaetia bacterium]